MKEQELIQACQAGDRTAFRSLFESHKDRVYTLAMHYCRDPAQAEDITQEVFLELFHSLRQFRRQAAFSTWLHRIVVNRCLNARRRDRRWTDLEETPARAWTARERQEESYGQQQLAEAIEDAMQRLDPELRLLLALRYREELSYAEIAEATDCSIGTVSSRLNRAHRRLGKQLWEYRSCLK